MPPRRGHAQRDFGGQPQAQDTGSSGGRRGDAGSSRGYGRGGDAASGSYVGGGPEQFRGGGRFGGSHRNRGRQQGTVSGEGSSQDWRQGPWGSQYGGRGGGNSQDWRYQEEGSGGRGQFRGGSVSGYGEARGGGLGGRGSSWRGGEHGGGRGDYRGGRFSQGGPSHQRGYGEQYTEQQHTDEPTSSSGSRGSTSQGISGMWAPAPPLADLLPSHQRGYGEQYREQQHTDEPTSSSGSRGSTSHGISGMWAPTPPLADLLPGLSMEDTEASSHPSTSKVTLIAPKRPPVGKMGVAVMVRANHFKVDLEGNGEIYQYDIDVTPKVSSKAAARRLERLLLDVHKVEFGGRMPAYDGGKSLYTSGELSFSKKEFVILLSEENVEKKYVIVVRHVATFNKRTLDNFLQGREASIPQEHLQALDVAFREFPVLHYIPVARSFYKRELGCSQLSGGLSAWKGFYQSLRATAQGLALNVDLAATAFYQNIGVIEFLQQKLPNFNPTARMNDAMRMQVKKALGRLRVEVIHRETRRKYRIVGLSPISVRDLKFPLDGGEEISIVSYFQNTYNYRIRYLDLPCVQVQAKKTSYLPMEVCKICDGQKYGGKLNEMQTTGLLQIACLWPSDRERAIVDLMHKTDGPGSGQFITSFGLRVSRDLTTIRARLLRPPKLKYGEHGRVKEVDPRYGKWNMLQSCLVEGGQVLRWAMISFDNSIREDMAYKFAFDLSRRCVDLGVEMVEEPIVPPLLMGKFDLEGPRLERSLHNVCDRAAQAMRNMNLSGHLQLLVCIMGQKHPAYGELKRICETQIGVVTQCCLSKNIKKSNSQYLANLVLKINAKVGGRNNMLAIELPRLCRAFNSPAIIFGADVAHPHPGDDTSPSISALVANTDWPSAIRYVARVRAQPHREEIITALKEMVQDLWREFCDKTKLRPEKVIMFRDGVSEGQFDSVLQREVVAFKDALHEIGGVDYKPSITWVVVQKRHHTRLFPGDGNKDENGNIMAGTVVDHTITHPREFDFYLCSHQGIKGTSRPTHYHVLWDENGFSSDELQGLVNNLCYTYARCTRSVSIVPPAYYAHLAAYRSRLYIEGQGGSDTASQRVPSESGSGGRSSRAAPPPIRALPQINKKVQDVMYFC